MLVESLTEEQARKIGTIVSTADGGCVVCVADLVEQLREIWPEHTWAKYADLDEEYLD